MDNLDNIIFNEIINITSYIGNDLITMSKIKPIKNTAGNCNFPIALFCLSSIEFLGYLSSKKVIKSKSGSSKSRILAFVDIFFDDSSQKNINYYREKFVDTFRNGLTHNFFPKMAGISRNGDRLLCLNNNGILILDADRLADAVIISIDSFIKKMEDPLFKTQVISRYKNSIKREKYQSYNLSSDRNSFLSSGASLSAVMIPKNYSTSSEYNIIVDNNNDH